MPEIGAVGLVLVIDALVSPALELLNSDTMPQHEFGMAPLFWLATLLAPKNRGAMQQFMQQKFESHHKPLYALERVTAGPTSAHRRNSDGPMSELHGLVRSLEVLGNHFYTHAGPVATSEPCMPSHNVFELRPYQH